MQLKAVRKATHAKNGARHCYNHARNLAAATIVTIMHTTLCILVAQCCEHEIDSVLPREVRPFDGNSIDGGGGGGVGGGCVGGGGGVGGGVHDDGRRRC